MVIIGICGFQGSGKDTVANYLVNHYNFKKLSFASILKDIVSIIFNWDRNMLEGLTKEARLQREIVDEWWSKNLNIPHFTPRYALQYIGTDIFRKHFHNDIWILTLENKIQQYENVVISDCRYMNEITLIENTLNGEMIYIQRNDEKPEWFNEVLLFGNTKNIPHTLHESEWNWILKCPKKCIKNNSTIEDLHKQIDEMFI